VATGAVRLQAGAKKVYAIEASNMVTFAHKLFEGNGEAGQRIQLLHGKLETLVNSIPEKADILVSEPMGTLLVNERMLETYIFARKHMLKPGGLMFPTNGRIFMAAFSDAQLFAELQGMAAFWLNTSFYGVNLSPLHADALQVRLAISIASFQSRRGRD
jgi:type I protein arginine methyltransferase